MESQELQGLGAPLCHTTSGQPAFILAQGKSPHKILVLTVPKSGTYLLAAMLEAMGQVNAGVLITQYSFTDNRNLSASESLTRHREFTFPLPAKAALSLILPGQFATSHLWHMPQNTEMLADFKVIFSYREARASMISWMRLWMNENRGDFEDNSWRAIADDKKRMEFFMAHRAVQLIYHMHQMAQWIGYPGFHTVSFEALVGDGGVEAHIQTIKNIASYVHIPLDDVGAQRVIASCIGAQTVTWTGKRSQLEHYWTEECERLFAEAGGHELNALLGYSG